MTRPFPAIALGLLLAASPAAQRGRVGGIPEPPPQAPVAQFRSGVEIVHLDVSVLDRDRRPVRGLTPEAFTILADGKPQDVAVFSAVEIDEPAPPTAKWMRDVAPDVHSNDGLQERRLFLILIDDAAIEAGPHAAKNVATIARGVIDQLGSSDMAAVIFTRDNRNSQDFTTDRARLMAAAGKYTVGFRGMAGAGIAGGDDLFYSYSVGVIESAVEMFTSLPDRRKSIIYIGQGVPVDFEQIATPAAPGLPPLGGASAIASQGAMSALQRRMERTFEKAARANVNVYPIDVCGARVPPGSPPPSPTCVPGLEQDYLRTVASNTGGRAVIDTNTFDAGIDAIFDENSAYYLLGFRPTDVRQDGKVRRLEVRVNRPGLEVRTRSGYEATSSDAARRREQLARQPLGAALAGVLPKSDLPLQIAAVPFAIPGKRESAVAVVVGVRQPIRQSESRTVEKVDVQVSAFNVEGKSFGSTRFTANVAVRAGATGLAEYEVASRIDLRPGRYQLRIAANAGSLSTSGSIYYDIDVPDFSAAPVTLSGLVLNAAPGPISAGQESLRSVLPFAPTTRRVFAGADRVAAFARLYQGGKEPLAPVPVHVQLRNALDTVVLESRQNIEPASFTSARSADVRVDLPIAQLPPGEYLLTIGTPGGRRDLRFQVLN